MIGDSSNLARFQPRQAVLAAVPDHKAHERAVAYVAKKVNHRESKLPMTDMEFRQRARSTR